MPGQDSSSLQIKPLLGFGEQVDADVLGNKQDLQGLLIHIMVLLLFDLLDVVIISRNADLDRFRMGNNCKYLLADGFGFGLLGEE